MRKIRWYIWGGLCLSAGGVALWSSISGREISDVVGGLALVVAVATLVAELHNQSRERDKEQASLAESVDSLARMIHEEWRGEAAARRLTEKWQSDPAISGSSTARVIRLRWVYEPGLDSVTTPQMPIQDLRFKLAESFDTAANRLVDHFVGHKARRMVIVGEPGSGKTVLAILLTVGLLAQRRTDQPTPVLLTLSSWDPPSESLLAWIKRQVADIHFSGRTAAAERLVAEGRLMPVLDGLDEMPQSVRRDAVDAINKVIDDLPGCVVTCRAAEYADVIAGGSPGLHQAPTARVLPLPAAEIIEYLSPSSPTGKTDWSDVVQELNQRPDGHLAQALSTPLMVSIAATVYRSGVRRPAELTILTTRHAIEDHLLDGLIDAAYEPRLGDDLKPRRESSGVKARRWLTVLAHYLHIHRDRDLAWWEMSRRLLPTWVAPVVAITGGLILGLFFGSAMALAAMATSSDTAAEWLSIGTVSGATAGSVFLSFSVFIWYATPGLGPGRLATSSVGTLRRLTKGFRVGAALIAIPGVPALLIFAVVMRAAGPWTFENTEVLTAASSALVGAMVLCGASLAGHSWFHAESGKAAKADALTSLRHDRRSALVGAAVAGVVVAICIVPVGTVVVAVGTGLGLMVSGWPGEMVDSRTWLANTLAEIDHDWQNVLKQGPLFATSMAGLAITYALLVLLTRSWTRFVVTRVVLACRGQLPLRLMRFMADARDRELLRQSGGRYQFRHIRLQERLLSKESASRIEAEGGGTRRSARRFRALVAALTAASVLGVVVMLIPVFPIDGSASTITDKSGAVDDLTVNNEGSLIATADEDDEIRVWDSTGPTLVHTFKSKGVAERDTPSLQFSPDQRTLAAVTAVRLDLWNASSGEYLWGTSLAAGRGFRRVTFGPTGRTIAVTATVTDIYDVAGGDLLLNTEPDFSYHPDEKMIAAPATNSAVEILEIDTGNKIGEIRTEARSGVTWSPDGSVLVTFNGYATRAWQLDPGAKSVKQMQLRNPQYLRVNNVEKAVFRPDGILVTLEQAYEYSNTSNCEISVLPSSLQLKPRFWRLDFKGVYQELEESIANKSEIGIAKGLKLITFRPQGSCTGTSFFDMESGSLIYHVPMEIPASKYYGYESPGRTYPAISMHRNDLYTAYAEGDTIFIQRIATGVIAKRLRGHVGSVQEIAFTDNGSIVSRGADGTIRIWTAVE